MGTSWHFPKWGGGQSRDCFLNPLLDVFLQFEHENFPTVLWPFCGANSAFLDVAIYASISVIH